MAAWPFPDWACSEPARARQVHLTITASPENMRLTMSVIPYAADLRAGYQFAMVQLVLIHRAARLAKWRSARDTM